MILRNSNATCSRHCAAMSYTLRTTHTMRAMRIIVPRTPPIYIRISVNPSELLLTHIQVTLSGR